MKTQNNKYIALVSQAKSILKDMNRNKMDVADLAIKACTISLGGHKGGTYSLKNFADDVGMLTQTLSNWIHIRKIELSLEKKKITGVKDSELTRIRLVLSKGGDKGPDCVSKYSNPDKVFAAFGVVKSETTEDDNLRRMIDTSQTTKFRLNSYVLHKLDQGKLSELQTITEDILEILIQHKIPKTKLIKKELVAQ